MSNGKNRNGITEILAKGFALILLALMTVSSAWGQLLGAGTEDNPYLIESAADWDTLTKNINEKGLGATSYYLLTNDITLGTASHPITTVVGINNKYFRGHFDGGFHTIHINMLRDENYAALFGLVSGATFKNLKVDGIINTDHKFAGGIAAYINTKICDDKETNIINCISSVRINCENIITIDENKPFDCTHGGFVGQNEHGILNFENCIFDGQIKDNRDPEERTANKCTGFVAWVSNGTVVNYYNCAMAGTIEVKPNDSDLKNSMANFHRLGASGKAFFHGTSYFIIDYTHPELTIQGTQAPVMIPQEAISKIYHANGINYYIPAAKIKDNVVKYHGWTLNEGTDYLINKGEDDEIRSYNGINAYCGIVNASTLVPVFQMDIDPWGSKGQNGWYAICSPTSNQAFVDVENMISLTVKHNIYRWHESKRQWQEYRDINNVFTEFTPGFGYIYRTEDNGGNISFYGAANQGDINCKLSKTDKDDNLSGINLLGNPYPHTIYKGVAIPNEYLAKGYCTLTENGTWRFHTDDEEIPVGTAILVQATDGKTITMKDTDAAPAEQDSNDEIWFTIKNTKYSDVAHVEFSEGEGFRKVAHYNDEAPMLYVMYDDNAYMSANLSDDTHTFNLCFKTTETDQYTLSFNANGKFNYLHLIDRMTGKDIDMLIEDRYTFVSTSNDMADRFLVRLKFDAIAPVMEDIEEETQFAWQNGTDLMVNGAGELQVIDITGRMVYNTVINGLERVNINSKGVYVLRLLGDEVKTQKIVIR